MRTTYLAALAVAMVGSGTVAADPPTDALVEACRLVVANEPALAHFRVDSVDRWEQDGHPVVTFEVSGTEAWERGQVSCAFDNEHEPPQLIRFIQATCYECNIWYDDQTLADANARLAAHWPAKGEGE